MKRSEDIWDRKNRVSLGVKFFTEDEAAILKQMQQLPEATPPPKDPTHVKDGCDDPFKIGCKEKPNYFRRGINGAVCAKCFEKMLRQRKITDPDEWDIGIW